FKSRFEMFSNLSGDKLFVGQIGIALFQQIKPQFHVHFIYIFPVLQIELEKEEVDKCLSFRTKAKTISNISFAGMYTGAMIVLYVQMIAVNKVFQVKIGSLIYWLFIFPSGVAYIFYGRK